ncbi:MAG: O-antigen translocase [Bacteroidota bacterium]|jgi:O-antigen/teichoic acid export membrane protein|nr:O-antigen translocase [Bacteroidota bacterium]
MLKSIKGSEFSRNVLILFTGSALSQVIPFIALPILQKYFFTPSDFGILAVFISFCELFANIACLKLEYGIVLQKQLKDAVNLAYGALRISWLMALLSLILIVVFKDRIAAHFDEPRMENYLFLLPLYIIFVGFNDIMSYWSNKKKEFSVLSTSKVIQTFSAESIKLISGLLKFNFLGLLLGRVIGFGASSLYFLGRFLKTDRKALRLLNTKHSNELIKKNRQFIFFTTPSVFTGSLINALYLNLFLHYFGKETVGMIGVSMTYLAAGLGVISVSFSQVFYSKIAETHSKAEILSMYKRFSKNLFLISLVPLLFVYLIPTSLVVYFLGEKWSELMVIARVMVIWLCVWFVSSSLSFIYMRLGKQKQMLMYDLLHLIIVGAGFYIAYFIKPTVYSALWGFTIAQVAFYLFIIYVAIRFIHKADENTL